MHKTTRLKLTDLNHHLVCVLCSGYFVDATSIIECLHSFCKSCITKYLEGNKCCPICDVQVHKTRPLLNLRPDKTLQMLVYKLIPGLYKKEMLRRRDFYRTHPGDAPSTSSPNASEERGEADPDRYMTQEEPEKISLIMQHCDRLPLPSNSLCRKHTPSTKTTADRRYLLCPAGVNVAHLKKFIRSKFDIQYGYQVELFYHGDETLPEDYTLADVAYVYGWTRNEPLTIFYVVLDKKEVCLKLPTPSQSCPILIEKTNESVTAPQQDSASDPDISLMQKDDVFNNCDELINRASSPVIKSDDDLAVAANSPPSAPTPELQESPELTIEERPERKHSHKKKKKKKKHKRSKSKEDKESTEEPIRSVIKVRIPKDKISQCIFNGSPYLETPNQSADDEYDSQFDDPTDEISIANRDRDMKSNAGSCVSDNDDRLNDNVYSAEQLDTAESKCDLENSDLLTTDKPATSNSATLKSVLNKCDNESVNSVMDRSLDHSVCSSLDSGVATSGNKLPTSPSQEGDRDSPTAVENGTDELSFLSDSDQDSFFDSSQTSHKEYTCEISRDGKVVFHSSKPSGAPCKLISSMDIVVEENPPQIIVVDKDAELKMDKLELPVDKKDTSAKVKSPTNGKLLHSITNGDTKQGNITKDINSKHTFDTSIDNLAVEGRVEVEPPVLVEVDASGTLIDSPSQITDTKDIASNSANVSSPSEANCSANEPMNCARTDAHAFPLESKHSNPEERHGVPLNVHSSLSPPGARNSLKRTITTESATLHKQAKFSSKYTGNSFREPPSGVPNAIRDYNKPSATTALHAIPSRPESGLSSSDKPRPPPGVYSSLSPPNYNGKPVSDNRCHGLGQPVEFPRVDTKRPTTGNFVSTASQSSQITAHQSSFKMVHRLERNHSRKPSKRGPLKERPVTLPVSHGVTISKTCSPVPKPRIYSHVPNFPLFQPHIHPSLSAISAVAAHMHGDSHTVPAHMKQLRLMCGEMGIPTPPLPTPTLPQAYPIQPPGFLAANSRHFLSPIFSPPLPARSLPSPLSPTRASPLSPNHFGPISPAHFGPMSPPRMSPPSMHTMGMAAHLQIPGYDSPLELTTRKAQDRHRDFSSERNTMAAPVAAASDKT